jgi:type IV pilus assembly protein PilC
MPTYDFKASDRKGKMVDSTLIAESRPDALQQLRQQGLTPLELTEGGRSVAKKLKKASAFSLGGVRKAKPTEVAVFFRQLSISISAGVPLRDSLENIVQEIDRSNLKQSIERSIDDLHSGKRFAEALTRNNVQNVFSPVTLGLTKVAEETGTLAETLNELSDYLEDMVKMKGDITAKTAYPVFMIVAFTAIMIGATFFLFPMFEENFATLGAALPPLTVRIFAINRFGVAIGPYVIGLLGVIVGCLAIFRRGKEGRVKFDRVLLRLPLFGPLLYKIGAGRFCRTLAITAKGGVALLEGLEISSCVVGNKCLESHLDQVRERISNGSSFGRSIRDTEAFSGLVVRMIEVGEESGQLALVLDKVSEVYDGEVNRAIVKMTSLIEPLIIIIFAVFVTIMVLALYMPIFSMSGSM